MSVNGHHLVVTYQRLVGEVLKVYLLGFGAWKLRMITVFEKMLGPSYH
jgi:hypothetical protein